MLQEVPGTGIASDQPYRLADLAGDSDLSKYIL